jgi:3-hydroxyanthranilate 3,4-dioxygenase
MLAPLNLQKWIDEHRHLLKPPVGNQVVYKGNDDFIVMVVGGPNSRKDFHYNEGEELFYQLEGDIIVKIIENGKIKEIEVKQGDLFLLPAKVPHCPTRGAHTVGLVIERYRKSHEKDACQWYCEQCHHLLHENQFNLTDIVKELPLVMENFYTSLDLRTCKKCGSVMEPPQKLS